MPLPTVDQLRTVAATLQRAVGSEDLDLNGHMNATHLFSAHIASVRASLAEVGVSEEYVSKRGLGTFAVEHHIRYLGELREGNRYSVRVRFLERTGKAIHGVSYLVNESSATLANVLEVIVVHVDQTTRRATGIPEDVTAQIDEQIRMGNELGWTHDLRLTLRRRGRN
ncbi:thioesterase family protein [Geodermatophilus sp. CPCC 205506]|uniref:thioesterase family protein n=1 Tax=Geodermatophilus sp. CPCC 205506 TaxID=2936596 RepID=UPI003EE9A280